MSIDWLSLRISISIIALIGIGLIFFLPKVANITTNPTVVILVIMFFIPWLQPFIKKLSSPLGEVEYREAVRPIEKQIGLSTPELVRLYKQATAELDSYKRKRKRG